jgi:tetratricopeptide (TPR) repeat protein
LKKRCLDPKNDAYLEMLARTCASQSQYAQALAYLERSLELNPWHARNYVLKAELLAFLGDRERALEAMEKALALDPNQRDLSERIKQLLRTAER